MITLGLLSDTHGRSEIAHEAVALLLEHGADVLVHLGDVGSTHVIDALAVVSPSTHKQVEAHLVFGNCDWEAKSLAKYAQTVGVTVHDGSGELDIDSKRVAFMHGHQAGPVDQALDRGVDYLLHGHTHRQRDETVGPTRVINPGALFRASRLTVALLTPASGDLRVLDVASVLR